AVGEKGVESNRLPSLDVVPGPGPGYRISGLQHLQCRGSRTAGFVRIDRIGSRACSRGNGRRTAIVQPAQSLLLKGVIVRGCGLGSAHRIQDVAVLVDRAVRPNRGRGAAIQQVRMVETKGMSQFMIDSMQIQTVAVDPALRRCPPDI